MYAPAPVDPTDFARRLASRLEEKGWGYKDFQRRVREATGGARGTSYGSVWAYVNGEVAEPRPRIVAAMADVLGLSREWLATGEGPRTREEAVRHELEGAPGFGDGDAHMRALVGAMDGARRRLPPLEARLLSRRDRVLEDLVVDLLESGGRDLDTWGEGEVAEAVTLVARLLTLPLRMLDHDEPERAAADGGSYVLAMAAALRCALPRPPHGQPLHVLARLRRLRAALQDVDGSEPVGGSPGAQTTTH